MLKDRQSYQIMQSALEIYKKKRGKDEINYSELSKNTGCTISSLWFYFKGERRWPADAWIKTLQELGALHVSKNSILITLKAPFVPGENEVEK